MTEPALGVLEVQSVARGVVVCDVMVKRAPVRVLQNHPISPGKHIVIAVGGVAEVEEAMGAGAAVASATLVDRLFLPQADAQLAPLVARGAAGVPAWAGGALPATDPKSIAGVTVDLDAVAVVETFTVCSCLAAADAAAKAAGVTLLDMRLGQGLGGKAFFTLTGDLESVEASVLAARAAIEGGLLVGTEIIAAPHQDLRRRLMW